MCCDDHTCLSGQSGFASFIGKDFPRDTIISKLQPSLHSTGWKLVILKLEPCVYTVSRTNNSTVVREEIQESFKVCYTDCTLPVRTSFCFEIKLFICSLLFLSKHFFFQSSDASFFAVSADAQNTLLQSLFRYQGGTPLTDLLLHLLFGPEKPKNKVAVHYYIDRPIFWKSYFTLLIVKVPKVLNDRQNPDSAVVSKTHTYRIQTI